MTVRGEVYATISADAVDVGISTLAVSGGTTVVGNENVTVRIEWSYDPGLGSGGITGESWFIGQSYSPITDWFNEDEFNEFLSTKSEDCIEGIIDGYMNNWSAENKVALWDAQSSSMYGCLTLLASS